MSLGGVAADVFGKAFQRRLVADEMIEAFVHPECSLAVQDFIDPVGGVGLPGVENAVETPSWQRTK